MKGISLQRAAGYLAALAVAVATVAGAQPRTEGKKPVAKMGGVVRVTDFGATPGDPSDDTAAVLAAIEHATKTKARRLEFPKGQYRFAPADAARPGRILFQLQNAENLTIDGMGSELIFSGTSGCFWFGGCRNITVRNLTIDWDRMPFSVGKVIAAARQSFLVQVRPEYPVHGGEPVGAFMEYDAETELPAQNGLDVYSAVERTELVGPQLLRVHLTREIPVPVGRLVVLRHQVYSYNGFTADRCTNMKYEDLTLYTVPGMGFVSIVCKDVTLRRCAVTVKPGTHRIMSATADASHFGGCKGTVRLEGCRFDGMGDDGVNIKSGLYLTVKERVDDHTVLAAHNLKMADVPDAGDTMEMSHVADLIPYGSATVVKAVNQGGPEGIHRVEFAEPLPEALQAGDVLGNATRTPRVRIKDCRIGPNRARGMLLQTRDVVVEGCTFTRCTSAGVLVLTEVVYFFESIGTRNVTIRNNTFIDCNYGAAGASGALCALAWLKGFAEPPRPGVHRDIAFRNNRVVGTDNCGIYVSGVAGITISGNQVEQASRKPTAPSGSAALYVRGSSGIKLQANRIPADKQGKGFKTTVEYGPGCEGVGEAKLR